MTEDRTQRLRMLAEHLLHGKLGHKQFDFGTWNAPAQPKCGTAGCALGECPIVWPEEWGWDSFGEPGICSKMRQETLRCRVRCADSSRRLWAFSTVRVTCAMESAQEFFGLTNEEARHLFVPDCQDPLTYGGKHLGASATREQVANNILAFLEEQS